MKLLPHLYSLSLRAVVDRSCEVERNCRYNGALDTHTVLLSSSDISWHIAQREPTYSSPL